MKNRTTKTDDIIPEINYEYYKDYYSIYTSTLNPILNLKYIYLIFLSNEE